MTTTKQYDSLNRLTNISSTIGSSAIGNSYGYNNANQRTRSTLPDNSYWAYDYDNLGQVTSGKKHWSDTSLVAGQQFEYVFDDIGNRTSTHAGGDSAGQGLHGASYTPNNLNQYIQRDIPGYVSTLGSANANATVMLWADGGAYAQAYRHGDYFRAELSVDNSSGSLPIWFNVTNIALLHNGSDYLATSTGHQFLPHSPEHFTYDDDGNLTQDGRWNYTWDAENRLVALTPSTAVGPQLSLKFEYDWRGRRIHKQVWDHASWNGTVTNDTKFVYDGWNLIAELDALNASTLLSSYVWGSDLSGTMQGAGGIGGLLFIRDLPSAIWYSPAFDGNGNIAGLVSMANATVAAQYEYGPFGEVLRMTGPMAKANTFRFSTKYQDDETDLLYYGYRYYNPGGGTALSRDPEEEGGGRNLYVLVANDYQNRVDALGRNYLSLRFGYDSSVTDISQTVKNTSPKTSELENGHGQNAFGCSKPGTEPHDSRLN
jgi:RHS repeat-associated protein